MSKRIAVLGLGSNIDPLNNLRKALLELRKQSIFNVLNISKIYESEALLTSQAPQEWNKPYLNAAVLIELMYNDPHELLKVTQSVEKKLNRNKIDKWSPRTIDIDILFIENEIINLPGIQIPHPELDNRPFALLPLLDVYPQYQPANAVWLSEALRPLNTKKSDQFVWPKLVGILNITSDSFSQDGLYQVDQAKIDQHKLEIQIKSMLTDGAEVIDIGAESTRPGAVAVASLLELERLTQALEVIQSFRRHHNFEISIDSRKAQVMQKIIQKFNIEYMNDVEGFRDSSMLELAKDFSGKIICMHSFSVPPVKSEIIEGDAFTFLNSWWSSKLEEFQEKQIPKDKIIFDVGIGFGKSPEQSFEILENMHKFADIKNEIYIGHSRKSFLTTITDAIASERDQATAQVTAKINQAYCQYLRVHNIQINKKALL